MADNVKDVKQEEHTPSNPHEKHIADYVFSNFSPLIGHAVRKLKAKGHLPSNATEEDHHEHGINGLMHAVNAYDPEVGPFKPYALRTIMGHILTANKHKQVSQADVSNIKSFRQEGETPQQVVQPKDSSRKVVEELGGGFTDGGGEGGQSYGVTTEKDPSIAAAKIAQNVPEAREWLQSKIEQTKRRINPALLSEDARKRFEAINQARSTQTPAQTQASPTQEQPVAPAPSQHGQVKSVTDPAELARIQAEYEKKYKR